jgi:hypothetical protein
MGTTPNSIARALREHCDRYGAGFYTQRGRMYGARVKGGTLQWLAGFPSNWVDAPEGAHYWNHNGRPIGNLPFKP